MNYDLVFEGGGARGIVFVGAMQEFEAQEHTFGRLLGASAGAITATFLAAGYTSREMLAALDEREDNQPVFMGFLGDPDKFDDEAIGRSATLALLRDINLPLVPEVVERPADFWLAKALMQSSAHLFSFIERGGWYSADKFVGWMKRKLDEGSFQGWPRRFSDMTLAQFYQATGGRELSLIASDTSAERMLVLNHRTAPNLPLVWAVRMSMNIPLIWPEVVWLAEWGQYRDKDVAGHYLVDGGLMSNFPLELFVSKDPVVTAVMGPVPVGTQVMGLLIDENQAVPGAPPRPEPGRFELDRFQLIQCLTRLINTIITGHDKKVIEAFENCVVRLPARGYGSTEFAMTGERREALIQAGRNTMRDYLARPVFITPVTELDGASQANRTAGRILEW